jgi:uncharacterized DUF497 family protein
VPVFIPSLWLVSFLKTGQFEFDWDDGNVAKNWVKHAQTLFVIFVERKEKVRIVSARPANSRERRLYDKRSR